ncbi:hypothetical protein BGZ74_003782 [Mortierella antarctica]|nr:hypothetical protein BGZ74_003782 [Mortierella antarctica]
MSFRQAMDSQNPHLHLMDTEQQQREQLLQMQQQQHLLAGAMPVSELTLQQSAILIQEQINAQSRSHTPIIPSQQPNNQPRGMHRQTPSFDGHIQPTLDMQVLNAQIHQHRQHAHDMMTAAMVTSQQALLSPIEGGMNLIMPTAQNLAGLQGPRITTNIQERDSSLGFSVMSPGTHPPIELAYPTPLPSTESMISFPPTVPSMQPTPSLLSASSPPDPTPGSVTDLSKRHRRHPSSGNHSPELRIVFQKEFLNKQHDAMQQQQQKIAAKESIENLQHVEPHQTRSPRTVAAAGLRINVSDIQARAIANPLSALGSPTETGHHSPGPLSAPSPILGPTSSLADLMEVNTTFQLHNLNDPTHPPLPKTETKKETEMLDPPSTRSELAELSKQELIEKVMEYERQLEGSLPYRRMSTVKDSVNQEPVVKQEPSDEKSSLDASSSQHVPPRSAVSPPPPVPSPPPQIKGEAHSGDESRDRKLTSPTLSAYAVKSPTNLHAVLSNQTEDDDDPDDEEDVDELDEDENDEDGETGQPSKLRKGSTAGVDDDLETPQQLVCEWRDCNQEFDSMILLNQHVAEQHIGGGKACYSCDWKDCPRMMKPFTKRHKMYNHLRTHTGERPFRCTVPGCDKKFSRPDSLTTHTKTHSNVRPYVCQVEGCPKAYYHARSLKKHELAHDIKPPHQGALRGSGATHGAGSITHGDKSGAESGVTKAQHPHFSHPYHKEFTAGTARANKHRRQHSQSAFANTGANGSTPVSDPPLVPAGLVLTPMGSAASSDASSPNPVSMAGGGSGGLSLTGFNNPLVSPALTPHPSTSSVPSLSMVMSSTPMSGQESEGMAMMDTMYQNGMSMMNEGAHNPMSSGSPGFQSTIAAATLTSPTTMSMPMPITTMSMPVTMVPNMMGPSPMVMSSLPPPGVDMSMIGDGSGAMYMMSGNQANVDYVSATVDPRQM